MNNKVKAALAGAGALTAVNAVRAAVFVPEKKDWGTAEPEKIDVERAQEHISGAIQIKTVSYPDKSLVDFGEFEKFHKFLEESFPLIHKTMEKEIVHEASLMYRWKGTNPDLDPMAMLSHQDVVPIEEGTEDDWTHPAFSGYNDGEFIWGRGALDMKNHLICVMEAIENLIAEGFQPETSGRASSPSSAKAVTGRRERHRTSAIRNAITRLLFKKTLPLRNRTVHRMLLECNNYYSLSIAPCQALFAGEKRKKL